MTITSLIATAATLFNLLSVPAFDPTPAGNQPLLVRGGTSGRITADFSQVEYFPNLKSKIGFAANLRNVAIADAGAFLDELGPGMMCGHIEFDHWFKWQADPVPALSEQFETPGDLTTRPVVTNPRPGQWLTDYEQMLGDLDLSIFFQLSGAPAQFQVARTAKSAPHPAPTDPAAAAAFVGQWVADANHPYPVRWSLWNEPGHELNAVERKMDVTGREIMAKESKPNLEARNRDQRNRAAEVITDLYALYRQAMAKTTGRYTTFGLSSFIAADFNGDKLTSDSDVFFKDVFDNLIANHPGTAVDFLSFNSFNGNWPNILSGARSVLAGKIATGPIILSQYAPRSLKVNEDGTASKAVGAISATPLDVATDMMTDLAQMERATDLQHVCMAYWVSNQYGFLSDKSAMVMRARYQVLRMFTQLPILRTRLDFGASGLEAQGLHGLAGINSGTAAVMLWNSSANRLDIALDLSGLPAALTGASARVTLMSEASDTPDTTPFTGDLTLPPHGVALVSLSAGGDDPLTRRHAVAAADGQTRFLATTSFTDRAPAACVANARLPKVTGCAANTGTYGFYDSVRSVAYLGKGTGAAPARVTASYETLPSPLYAAIAAYPAGQVELSVTFDACAQTVAATSAGGVAVLDFAAVPRSCRVGQPATVTLSLDGVPSGSQAEVYLSSSRADATALAAPSVPQPTGALPSVDEGLVIPSFGSE